MKTPLSLLFLLLPLWLFAAPPLAPLQHNFFTTNPAPVVDVVAGSNTVVTATLVGTDTRRFTVSATATPGQTNWSYTAITNAPWQWGSQNLTNWSQLSTNLLIDNDQTNWPYTSITNSPWQWGTQNITNWSQLNTNVFDPAGAATAVTNGFPWTNIYSPGISGGSTNQIYTQTGWSGYPQVTNLSLITNGIGTAVVPSLWLTNPTPAALNAQQNSPVFMQAGQGWRSGNSTTMPVAMGWGVVPVQGSSANPTAQYTLFKSISNAVPTSTGLYVNDVGTLTVPNSWTISNAGANNWQMFVTGGSYGTTFLKGSADPGSVVLRDKNDGNRLSVSTTGVSVTGDSIISGALTVTNSILSYSNITASATVSGTNGTFGTLTVSNNLTLTGTLTVSNISATSITGPITHTYYATNGYTVCTASKDVYMVNAYTNPLFVLPDASTVAGQEFIFTTTNVACFFIVTNKTGTQTIANGQYLSYTNDNNGQKVTSFISDGAHWWLGRKGKTILPSASWSCNTNITFPNVTNMVTLDTQEANNGVGIALDNSAWYTAGVGSRIWVTNAGMYLLTFSAMWSKVGGGAANGDVWLRQDGAMLPRTMTLQTIQNSSTTNVMTVNFILPVTKTTYFDLVGASPDGSAQMQAMPAITTPFARPAAPSMIVTIQKTSD